MDQLGHIQTEKHSDLYGMELCGFKGSFKVLVSKCQPWQLQSHILAPSKSGHKLLTLAIACQLTIIKQLCYSL